MPEEWYEASSTLTDTHKYSAQPNKFGYPVTQRLGFVYPCYIQYDCTGSGKIFYIYGSVHRNSILIRSNEMQQYARVYLLQNYSTCFWCPSHPSSGVHQTVTAASGTGHSIWANKFPPTWPKGHVGGNLFAQILWPVPEAAVTLWCTPDDGCDKHPKQRDVTDVTVCRYLFTAKLLYMFRVFIAPIIRSTSNCNCSF